MQANQRPSINSNVISGTQSTLTNDDHMKGSRFDMSKKIAWLMDNSIRLPGGLRVGVDGLIGLIPGVGDLVGGALSSWIIYIAYKKGAPKFILLRMTINALVDAAIGSIPIAGDLFDFIWKANSRNLKLLQDYEQNPKKTYRKNAATTSALIAGTVAVIILFISLIVILFRAVWEKLLA